MNFTRRKFLQQGTFAVAGVGLNLALPPWARSGTASNLTGMRPLAGKVFDLSVAAASSIIDGRRGHGVLVNEQLPAPLLRWREGDTVTLRVTNRLEVDTSIHWHGILLPFQMDGVPGVSFPGISPGETFVYEFPLQQAGTYWYHSHSGLQEQSGHYGPLIIEPREADPDSVEREYVILLSDWTFEDPHRVFAKLKKMPDNYNFQQRTVQEFFRDSREDGLASAVDDRLMWGDKRMNPTDIADVTGATYTYLINGHGPKDNWTGLFKPGERVRLRFINASAMSIFNVRIPGLPLSVVQADGLPVVPVETDEFQIGVAETFDVIVKPDDRAYTLMAESNDRYGYARATLAPREGMVAPVPELRSRPTLTMKDMAMDHGSMGSSDAGHESMDGGPVDHAAMGHGKMDHGAMNHDLMGNGTMDHAAMNPVSNHGRAAAPQAHDHVKGPGVVGLAANPVNRLHERPLGLQDEDHRVLVYTDLRARDCNPDVRMPGRELELHLTSNMERYMWSFDGVKFSEVDEPIKFYKGERVRLTLVNDTMMPHPIHLHGMFFEVVTNDSEFKPRKHTIVVKPGEKMSVDITADAVGDWAFHCHLLYHMHAGMMRVVSVVDELVPV
ncbi:copper-resistance protein, CopA family [Luminiphilus syltensis NOR5-1B]|uniref:Copper-resistance protein, CopA family n=1 Tax=Luminiphilus syltensis NOR5-1B TaxID=565045 RepID=B8KSI2_9GAMM|nr:copper resistance system multicopper oxidase [Luminiphilus syltensis]EED36615.1 copper-resistance protein, CopA family [Luminiphilus syltensis NOR5-1B]